MSTPLEIERVWVLRTMPSVPAGAEVWSVLQGYLPLVTDVERDPSFPEGRLRKITRPDGSTVYRHTIKRGAGLVREETERSIDVAEFERLWPQTAGRRVDKTRYRIRDGDLVWELDQFHSLPLVMLEVELPNTDVQPDLPAWARDIAEREVTFDARYRNAALAIDGVPSP